jgi:hypothetical protein
MKVLERLFPSKSVKELIACLDELQPLFVERQGRDFAWLVFEDIRNRAKAYFLEKSDKLAKAVRAPDYNPRVACLKVFVALARDDLATGRVNEDYIYRGTLSMHGEGKRTVFDIAMAELEKAGICTPEVRRMRSVELDDNIKENG